MSQTPPGPRGEPVFGSSRRYARDPFAFISSLESSYGDMAAFDLGPLDAYMVCEAETIERVLVSEADSFNKPGFQEGVIGDLLGDGLLLSDGDTWRKQRQLANPAFAMDRLAGMADRVTAVAEDTVADWSPGDRIDAVQPMTRATLEVILDLMMGVELPPDRVDTIQEQLEPLGRRFEPDPIRFAAPEWLPLPGDAEFESALETMEGILDDIVARRRTEIGTEEEGPMDFLSILLRARERGEQSDRQLRDELMTMVLAGHDTTALTLTYTLYLLSENPAADRRAHEEVVEVLDGESPGIEHVREFDYLERVIQEAMRLYPPVYTIFRSPTEPVELAGYHVDTDATVMLPQWGVHRSARYWEEPDRFDPDRFTAERSADRPRFAYFPFGGGPRHCIGRHLAMLEAKIILAAVLRDHRLEYLGDGLELLPSLTAHPRDGVPMRVEER